MGREQIIAFISHFAVIISLKIVVLVMFSWVVIPLHKVKFICRNKWDMELIRAECCDLGVSLFMQ